jgi:hypothetical protein
MSCGLQIPKFFETLPQEAGNILDGILNADQTDLSVSAVPEVLQTFAHSLPCEDLSSLDLRGFPHEKIVAPGCL